MTSSVSTRAIALSEVGASRAFDHLSPDAATLLMGMIRVMSHSGALEALVVEAASSMKMTNKAAIKGLKDLCRSGLLRRESDGSLVLHRIFGGYGLDLARRKRRRVSGSLGYVVALHGKET